VDSPNDVREKFLTPRSRNVTRGAARRSHSRRVATLAAMRRTSVIVAILIAMLWQSLAMARADSTLNVLADVEHAMLHWQGEDHHHHDDGSFHRDASDESERHLLADHHNASAVLPDASVRLALADAGSPAMHEPRAVPHPFLDGPLRPPRLIA
jgi:hypothetical protein